MNGTFKLEWVSTATERYDTQMLAQARGVLEEYGYPVLEEYGGTDFTSADNGFIIEATPAEAFEVALAMTKVVGHEVEVSEL
jgi:hypothetical protein